MSRENEKALTAGTIKGPKKTKRPVRNAYLNCITIMLLIATVVAGWHIEDVWDGVVTMLCGIATLLINLIVIEEANL